MTGRARPGWSRGFFAAFAIVASAVSAQAQEYVGSEVCTACHEAEAGAWSGSHHALAWTTPSPQTVLADFDGTEFLHNDGVLHRFRIEDDGYFVEITEADGAVSDHRIHSVAGVAPLQQYLIETEPGRLQSFDVVWDVDEGRW